MSRDIAKSVRLRLEAKERLTTRLAADPSLAATLTALRRWQAERLATTYADLRAESRYRPALEFFLSDLYGTHDFSPRDHDLHRAWRLMETTLPQPAMVVLADALELELLTLELDANVAAKLRGSSVDDASYAAAYRAADRRADRVRQIDLVVGLARRLSEVVRYAWIGSVLRLARAPAQAAGFAVLRSFLERGFAAFADLDDASRFVRAIDERERLLMERLFAGDPNPFTTIETSAEVKAS
jgi:hypothetical protein